MQCLSGFLPTAVLPAYGMWLTMLLVPRQARKEQGLSVPATALVLLVCYYILLWHLVEFSPWQQFFWCTVNTQQILRDRIDLVLITVANSTALIKSCYSNWKWQGINEKEHKHHPWDCLFRSWTMCLYLKCSKKMDRLLKKFGLQLIKNQLPAENKCEWYIVVENGRTWNNIEWWTRN